MRQSPHPYARHRVASARFWAAITIGTLAFVGTFPALTGTADATLTQIIGIPAYFYPAGANVAYWDRLRTGVPTVSVVIATGLRLEGTTPDTNYQYQIAKTRAAGIKVLAYVTTSSGDKPLATAKSEIDKAKTWYKVDGIFFDESVRYPVTCLQTEYYRSLSQHAKVGNAAAITVLNHGQILPECYASTADILMTAEMAGSVYESSWKPWGWEHRYPASKFWHLVHSVPTITQMQDIVRLSRNRNAGRVFVTSATMSSPGGPYGSLPPLDYWGAQLRAVAAPVVVTPTTLATTTTTKPPATTTTTKAPATTTTTKATTTTAVPTSTLAPTTSSFSPTSGPPGATVRIYGTNLSGVTMVTLNGGPVTIVGKTSTSVTVVVASWSTTGRFWVSAPGGLAAVSAGTFTVIR